MNYSKTGVTFNGPVEVGVRVVHLLLFLYPKELGLERLVLFDYFVVHSAEVGGPNSLHPSLPFQSKEMLVRRKLIETGLLLMASRGLVERKVSNDGIVYRAGGAASTFVSALEASYFEELRVRAQWVAERFGETEQEVLQERLGNFYKRWIAEFQNAERSLGVEL